MAFKLVLLYTFSTLFVQCNKYCARDVKFELPITIAPIKDTYIVGDTIWISMILPMQLLDTQTGELINVGTHHFDLGMNVLQLTDTSWTNGTQTISYFPDIGNLTTFGFSYPELVPELVFNESLNIQEWRFGIIPKISNINLVLFFQKRNNFSWSGVYHFPQDKCDYFIDNSTFLTNGGNIDYEYYVEKYPHFTETGKDGNLAENHREYGTFFFTVK